jgi:D-serine deaminase-like pyridoxal phosphate-dependent protein
LAEDAGIALGGLNAVQACLAVSIASDVIGRTNPQDAVCALSDALRSVGALVAAASAAKPADAKLAVAITAAVGVHGAGLAAHVSRGVLARTGLAEAAVRIAAVFVANASAPAARVALPIHAQVAVRVALAIRIDGAPDVTFSLPISGAEE